jgi:hypothetical protein
LSDEVFFLGSAWRRRVWVSVCLTLFFLLLSIRLVGISDGDDTWYQTHAVDFRASDFVTLHYWSPLYQLWFLIFSLAVHNPVWCYFACWAVLVLLFALIPVALNVRYGWIYTVIFVVFPFPFFSPYSGMFGSMLAVLALSLVLRSKLTYSGALAASCAMSFVLSACRSEFDTAVLLSAVATVVMAWFEWRESRGKSDAEQITRRLVTTAAVVLVLACGTVFVLAHAVGQRSGMAFAQHFNLRAAMRGQIPHRGFPVSNFAELQFGVDTTHNAGNGQAGMKEFFLAKPKLFLKHVLFNLIDPKTVLILLLLTFAVVYPWTLGSSRWLRPASLFMAIFAIPSFMDLCLVFPRDHYVMLLLPSMTLFALQAIPLRGMLRPPVWVLFAGMAAMAYINYVIPRLELQSPNPDLVYLNRVQCVRAVDATVPASNPLAFDDHNVRDVFLVHPRTQVDDFTLTTWDDFKTWALKNHPAWITSSEDVASWYHVTPVELNAFLQNDLGYEPHECSPMASMKIYSATSH